jgi:uncharacterized protein (DUF1778 family)
MSQTQRLVKRERLEARVSREQKLLFQRAAAIHGQTLSDYLVSLAQKDAEQTIREHEILTLSERDSRVFVDALLNPTGPNDALRTAFEDYKEFIGRTGQ